MPVLHIAHQVSTLHDFAVIGQFSETVGLYRGKNAPKPPQLEYVLHSRWWHISGTWRGGRTSNFNNILPACHMLARVAMALCLCLSVTSRCSIETDERIELVLAWDLSSTYPTLCYKEIRISSKIRVLPSGNLFQTQGRENFATAYRSSNVLST